MRVRPPSRASTSTTTRGRGRHTHTAARGNVQPYYPASAPPPYSVQKTLLGSTVRTAQVLTRDGRKGFYFIFQDMVRRRSQALTARTTVVDIPNSFRLYDLKGVMRLKEKFSTWRGTCEISLNHSPATHPFFSFPLSFSPGSCFSSAFSFLLFGSLAKQRLRGTLQSATYRYLDWSDASSGPLPGKCV